MAAVNSLIQLISSASLKDVFKPIQELINNLDDTSTRNTLIQLSGRYHNLEEKINNGTISHENSELETNKIRQSLIETISNIPAELLPNVDIVISSMKPPVHSPPPVSLSNGNPEKSTTNSNWPIYIGIGLVILITLLIIFIPCPSSAQYEVFHAILALCIAGLGAIIPGFLKVEYKGLLQAGGAMGLFVLVFWGGPDLPIAEGKCANEAFDLVLRLKPEKPNPEYPNLAEAQLWLWVGDDWEKKDITGDQVVEFKNLSPNLHGKKAEIKLIAQHYRLPFDSIPLLPDTRPIKLVPDWSLSKIQGKARLGAGGGFLPGVVIEVEGVKDTSDAFGNFEINIPPARQKEKYTLYASKLGYGLYETYVHPAGGKVEVPLKKK